MAYHLGIDLGTTYTAAAAERGGVVEALTLGNRSASVPSVVFLRDDGEILVGEAATRRATTDPGRVAREFKRRVGDPTPIILGGTPYAAEMLMARVLRWSVDRVCEQQGESPRAIALTHPANWGHYKLDLLTQAVRQVDLDAALLIAEPVAAATFYASQRRLEPGSVVAVYDLGGGTFDAAAVRRTADDSFEIIGSPEGIERLGGIDFDEAVFAHVRAAVGDGLDRLDPEEPTAQAAVARLRQECIDAKEALSSDTDVSIPVLLPGLQTEVRLTRAEFEAMIRPAISETLVALRRAIRTAGVTSEDISAVLLVGGSSRIPLVAQMVGVELGRPIAIDAHPKDAIAFGAAIAVAAERGTATPESVTTVLPDHRPPPPTVTPDAGSVRGRAHDPRPAPPTYPGGPPGSPQPGPVRPARPAPPVAPAAAAAAAAASAAALAPRPAPPGSQGPARPAPPGGGAGAPGSTGALTVPGSARPAPPSGAPSSPVTARQAPPGGGAGAPGSPSAPSPGAARPASPAGGGGPSSPISARQAPPGSGAGAPSSPAAPDRRIAASGLGAPDGGASNPRAAAPTPTPAGGVAPPTMRSSLTQPDRLVPPGAGSGPAPTPFGGTPRAGTSPLGGVSSGGHPPVPAGNVSMGGSSNRMLWIAAAVLAVVGLVGLVILFGQGDDGGGDDRLNTTGPTTTPIEQAESYNATIEQNFMDSCTADPEPGQAVCQCAYDQIEATVPFERFVEIDEELNQNPDARPQELVDILTECTSE
ncbi:MAG TPA: Hsp70 family protein [Acidimicrobiales bacterium]|nr:Hsp70 family protein [Acidimicrobiales bacterium]